MASKRTSFVGVSLSLADLCGEEYLESVCHARSFLTGESSSDLLRRARTPVEFFPEAFHAHLTRLLDRVGETVVPPMAAPSSAGASSSNFNKATSAAMAPLSGLGPFRIGEHGVLHLATKSEHYHASLGHGFPGYELVASARQLGIPNATHNNTRGHITRTLERELVAVAAGRSGGTGADLDDVLAATRLGVLNRVLNLETGSLAVEAALKMILARFYRVQEGMDPPKYAGKTPVILVVGDTGGGLGGNYHGTTLLTQVMRGMWPELTQRLDGAGAFQVRAIRPNNVADLDRAFAELQTDNTRIAGFFHEIVLMNYGGLTLRKDFLQRAYEHCARHDVPAVCDEIQSCLWNPEIFMFREYGLQPSFVSVGKGFPGGEFPASRILFSAAMDNGLPQFGALVTNGQEELASLSYLVTLAWARANAAVTREVGDYFQSRLRDLETRHTGLLTAVEGSRHMSAVHIGDLASAKTIAAALVAGGVDVSVQSYKEDCPPAILMKLPLIAGYEVADFVLGSLDNALAEHSLAAAAR